MHCNREELAVNVDNSLRQLITDIQAVAAYIASRAERFRDWVLHLIDEYRGSGGPGDTGIPQIRVYTGGCGRPSYYNSSITNEAMMELRLT